MLIISFNGWSKIMWKNNKGCDDEWFGLMVKVKDYNNG